MPKHKHGKSRGNHCQKETCEVEKKKKVRCPCPGPCDFVAQAIARAVITSNVVSGNTATISVTLNNPQIQPAQPVTLILSSPYGTASQFMLLTGGNTAVFMFPTGNTCPPANDTVSLSIFVPGCLQTNINLLLPFEMINCVNYGTANNGSTSTLYQIIPGNGSIGSTGVFIANLSTFSLSGIDVNPNTQLLYGLGSSGTTTQLYSIIPSTGTITSTTNITGGMPPWFDISFGATGVLYAVGSISTGHALYQVSLGGIASLNGSLPGQTGATGGNALAFNCDGRLYFVNNPGSTGGTGGTGVTGITGGTSILYRLDPGTATVLGQTGITFAAGFPQSDPSLTITSMDYSRCLNTILVVVRSSVGGSGSGAAYYLGSLNVGTGIVSFLGNTVSGLNTITTAIT